MMTFKAFTATFAFFLAGTGVASAAVSAGELRLLLEHREPLTVVDVRGESAYAEAHIPGAINVPLDVLREKRLPPLGRVVVCGDSIDTASLDRAVGLLSAKAGITAEPLTGGFDAWVAGGLPDTRVAGLSDERMRRVKAEDIVAMTGAGDFVVVDLRGAQGSARAGRDLEADFPKARKVVSHRRSSARGAAQGDSFGEMVRLGKEGGQLLVLVDDGDGESEALARKLKSAGVPRVAIVAGGELGLSR